jgi:hypothetical protein
MAKKNIHQLSRFTLFLVSDVAPFLTLVSGKCCVNLRKTVCCQKRAASRITHSLILKSEPEGRKIYREHIEELGVHNLPDQLEEEKPKLFKPPILSKNSSLDIMGEVNKVHRKSYRGKPPPFLAAFAKSETVIRCPLLALETERTIIEEEV